METHVPTVVMLVRDDVVAKHVDSALEQAVPSVVLHRISGPAPAARPLAAADVVISDGLVPGWEGLAGFHHARQGSPSVACVLVHESGRPAYETGDEAGLAALGVIRLGGAPEEIGARVADLLLARLNGPDQAGSGAELLVGIVQQLSLAPDLDSIMQIVRTAARRLSGADGATFVLRDRGYCYYADEDAIGPLWKGQRFPLQSCVSGWAMTRRQPAVVPDVFADPRVPTAAYQPTFVRSMVMVPIRGLDPIGAIGTYWAVPRDFAPAEVRLLQTLADSTAVAIENVRVQADLERRVRERTEELEAFTYAVSHDLRAPIRHVSGFASMAAGALDRGDTESVRTAVGRVSASAANMRELVSGLLELSRITRAEVRRVRVDLADLAREVALECADDVTHGVEFVAPEHAWAECDPALARLVLQNLIGNAYKFTAGTPAARVDFAVCGTDGADGEPDRFVVTDNGAGFNPDHAGRLFGVFQRLHDQRTFPGTGIGLASVRRIVQRHGGVVSGTGALDQGARFTFTLNPALAATSPSR